MASSPVLVKHGEQRKLAWHASPLPSPSQGFTPVSLLLWNHSVQCDTLSVPSHASHIENEPTAFNPPWPPLVCLIDVSPQTLTENQLCRDARFDTFQRRVKTVPCSGGLLGNCRFLVRRKLLRDFVKISSFVGSLGETGFWRSEVETSFIASPMTRSDHRLVPLLCISRFKWCLWATDYPRSRQSFWQLILI